MVGPHLRRSTGDHQHSRSPDRPTHPRPPGYFYPIFLFVVLAACHITFAVQEITVGASLDGEREDESVAEAMGVNIVTRRKLSTFVVGAILASFGGPDSSLLRSAPSFPIPSTSCVDHRPRDHHRGGMGSVPGVTSARWSSSVLPNLLSPEFSEYQFLFYGVLLIVMMLKRPRASSPANGGRRSCTPRSCRKIMAKIYGEKGQAEQVPQGGTV